MHQQRERRARTAAVIGKARREVDANRDSAEAGRRHITDAQSYELPIAVHALAGIGLDQTGA